MRKLVPAFILCMLFITSGSDLRAAAEETATPIFCFLTSTDPNDGNCPAQYQFTTIDDGSSFQWSVSGDAYFNSGTTSNQASVIPQRNYWNDGSFTVTLRKNGVVQCSKSYTVTAERYCI